MFVQTIVAKITRQKYDNMVRMPTICTKITTLGYRQSVLLTSRHVPVCAILHKIRKLSLMKIRILRNPALAGNNRGSSVRLVKVVKTPSRPQNSSLSPTAQIPANRAIHSPCSIPVCADQVSDTTTKEDQPSEPGTTSSKIIPGGFLSR